MPKRTRGKKSSKDKSRKKRISLSDKELIKLLKKLKPKNQQIVRVNVGDKTDKKKKGGEVQSSYNPPFVVPSQPAVSYFYNQPPNGQPPPPTFIDPQPQKALQAPSKREKELEDLLNQQKTDFEYQNQQFLMKQRLAEKVFEQPSESDLEPEIYTRPDFFPRQKRTNRKKERSMPEYEEPPESRFKPKIIRPTQLSMESYLTRKMTNEPSNNDPFMPFQIATNQENDQMGMSAKPVSSDEWVLSPDGTEAPLQTVIQEEPQKIDAPPEDEEDEDESEPIIPIPKPAPVKGKKIVIPAEFDIIPEDEPFASTEEEAQQQRQEEIDLIKGEMAKSGKKLLPPIKGAGLQHSESIYGMRQTLNDAILGLYGLEVYNGVPPEFISTKGLSKGQLKSGISQKDLKRIYNDYLNR